MLLVIYMALRSPDRPRPPFVLILLSAKRWPRECRDASLKCKFMRNHSDLCGPSNDLQTSLKSSQSDNVHTRIWIILTYSNVIYLTFARNDLRGNLGTVHHKSVLIFYTLNCPKVNFQLDEGPAYTCLVNTDLRVGCTWF